MKETVRVRFLAVMAIIAAIALVTSIVASNTNVLRPNKYEQQAIVQAAGSQVLTLSESNFSDYLVAQYNFVQAADGTWIFKAGECQVGTADPELALTSKAMPALFATDWWLEFYQSEMEKLATLEPETWKTVFLNDALAIEGFNKKFRSILTATAVKIGQPIAWSG